LDELSLFRRATVALLFGRIRTDRCHGHYGAAGWRAICFFERPVDRSCRVEYVFNLDCFIGFDLDSFFALAVAPIAYVCGVSAWRDVFDRHDAIGAAFG